MANTKKSTNVDKPNVVANENEALKAQIAAQQEQMNKMMAQMEMMSKMMAGVSAQPQQDATKRNITFISMVKGGLTLKGTRFYHIDKQFGKRIFPETEARIILNNMPETIQSGLVYIPDRAFIEENELSDYYVNLIDDKTLKSLLTQKPEYVMEIYDNACNEQKKIILDMVVDKKLNGEDVDANIVAQLSKACGKDLINIDALDEE